MVKLPELNTRSVLEIVEENFAKADLKTFAVRFIYAGEHALNKMEMIEHFKSSVHDVNSSYCTIHITGYLIMYESYFVHVLEGSEDTVHRQVRFLLQREQKYIAEALKEQEKHPKELPEGEEAPEIKMFKRVKVLMIYHSIDSLNFSKWQAIIARPPVLVGKLDIYGSLEEHMEQLRICLHKIRDFSELVTSFKVPLDEVAASDSKTLATLPEVGLLDFLLQSKYIESLHQVMHYHRRVDDYQYYFEQVWPLPTQFTPRLLYKLKVDDTFVEPLPIMPWEIAQKEAEQAERNEQEVDQNSDSD